MADGGYVLPCDLLEDSNRFALLSFGIGDDISFETAFHETYPHIEIFCFDPTIAKLPERKPFHFETWGLAGDDCDSERLYSLSTIVRRLGLSESKELILKVDIEGYEWEFIRKFKPSEWKIPLLVMELHFNWINRSAREFLFSAFQHYIRYSRIKRLLQDYMIVHFHANNYAYVNYSDFSFPKLPEITLARRDYLAALAEAQSKELDFVNCPGRVDIQLPFLR